MFHYGMTREQVGKCSLPFVFAIMGELGKRLCEQLGIPCKDVEKEVENVENVSNVSEEIYPLNNDINKEHYKNYNSKKSDQNIKRKYYASSKSDIINFFSGLADIEEK